MINVSWSKERSQSVRIFEFEEPKLLCDIAETHKQGRIAFISRKKKLTKHSPLLQVGFERVFGRRGKLLKRKPYVSVFTAFSSCPTSECWYENQTRGVFYLSKEVE